MILIKFITNKLETNSSISEGSVTTLTLIYTFIHLIIERYDL
jgi:hypothetical protein